MMFVDYKLVGATVSALLLFGLKVTKKAAQGLGKNVYLFFLFIYFSFA